MTHPTAPAFRIETPAQLVEAAPYLVGFVPHEQLLVFAFAGSALAMSVTVELSQAHGADDDQLAAGCRDMARSLRRTGGADGVILLLVSDADDRRMLPPALEALQQAQIEVRDALFLQHRKFWSALDPAAPVLPVPLTELSLLLLERVGMPARRRTEAAAELTPRVLPQQDLDTMRAAGGRTLARLLAGDPRALIQETLDWLVDVDEPTVDDAGTYAAALRDKTLRDACLSVLLAPQQRRAAMARLEFLAVVAEGPDRLAPLTLWALGAYLNGDALQAQLALKMALAEDRNYALARLLHTACRRVVPAGQLAELFAKLGVVGQGHPTP